MSHLNEHKVKIKKHMAARGEVGGSYGGKSHVTK